MKKAKKTTLHINRQTIKTLSSAALFGVHGGIQEVDSGSQGTYSGPCPPPKNGEGSGCVTG